MGRLLSERPRAVEAAPKRYRVLRKLRELGASVVFEAEDQQDGTRVGLETFQVPDATTRERVLSKLERLKRAAHPNLLELRELVEGQEGSWLVTELVEGVDFIEHSALPGPPSGSLACDERKLRDALPQLAQAIDALHRAAIVHGDLAPSSVLVTGEGRVVVTATHLLREELEEDTDTNPDTVAEALAYMSPEQAEGGSEIGSASDWYRFGALTYRALTGRVPFAGSAMEQLLSKRTYDPPMVHALVPDAPDDLAQLCNALLLREPERRPSGDAVLRELGVMDAETGMLQELTLALQPPRFVGRARELAFLELAFDAVRIKSTAVALVLGPEGVGKTALAEFFLHRLEAERDDITVVRTRCVARSPAAPRPVDVLLSQLRGPERTAAAGIEEAALLDRLLSWTRSSASAPSLDGTATPDLEEQRNRAFSSWREALRELCENRHIVFFVDDAESLDRDSLTLLAALLRAPEPPAVLILLCAETLPATVRHLIDDETVSFRVELEPLPPEASRDVVDDLGSAEARLTGLAELPRSILELIALASGPLEPALIAKALGLAPAEVDAGSYVLLQQRLVRSVRQATGLSFEPWHRQVAEATRASIDEDAARNLHRRLAAALARGDEERIIHHLLLAGDEDKTIAPAGIAARRALSEFAFERAAAYYQMLVASGVHNPERQRELLAALGEALLASGRLGESADALLSASAEADLETVVALEQRAAERLLRGGLFDRGQSAINVLLARIGERVAKTPLSALLRLLMRRAWLRLRGLRFRERPEGTLTLAERVRTEIYRFVTITLVIVDNIRASDFGVRHVLLALRLGEPTRVARALAMHSVAMASQGSLDAASRALGQARAIMIGTRHAWLLAIASAAEMIAHLLAENAWRKARRKYEEVEGFLLASAQPARWELDSAQAVGCTSMMFLAEFELLYRTLRRYEHEAIRRGDVFVLVTLRGQCNMVWLSRDDPTRAARDLDQAMALWTLPSSRNYHVQHFAAFHARSNIELYRSRPHAARDELERNWRNLTRSFLLRVPLIAAMSWGVRGRVALAEAAQHADKSPERAIFLREAARALKRLERMQWPLAQGTAPLLRAGLANLLGDGERAEQFLRQAIIRLERTETMLYSFAARRRLGELIGGEEGRELVDETDEWAQKRGIVSPQRMTAMLAPGFPDL